MNRQNPERILNKLNQSLTNLMRAKNPRRIRYWNKIHSKWHNNLNRYVEGGKYWLV